MGSDAIPTDIQLNAKGMKNLRESFRDYETLEGENKYQAEGHSSRMLKGVCIPVVPSLCCTFNSSASCTSCLDSNDRCEFPLSASLIIYREKTPIPLDTLII